ncbi:uncharacterized protein LOC135478242 [Liolophura sinensis]|uniref:uncharacterized protein LOC135478242 n=1 Tax=Liolophura sinensis TaxID=3198878 RepID=UPI003157F64E
MEGSSTLFAPFVCGIFLLSSLSAVSDGLILHSRPNTDHIIPDPRAESKEMRWTDAAYDFIKRLDCKDVFITSPKECKRLMKIPKKNMNVYVAGPTVYGRYRVNLPGESLTRSGPKDGVVVLDPYPKANFGHLVLVFFIEKNIMREVCERQGGHFAGYGDCLTLALKKRCKNALERTKRRRNMARRCEVNFLPAVMLNAGDDRKMYTLGRKSYLKCYELKGFAPCPELRPLNETSELICNPLRDNTQRCSTTHETVHTSCRVFEICDQAVIISGGWNRLMSTKRHKNNAWNFFHMLRDNGFLRRNIKIFFANGAKGGEQDVEERHSVHPAAMKLALRYHIQKICKSPHCVDSFVIYMNSPAKNDGTSLLWDLNGDGLAEDSEKYTVRELKHDLHKCAARQVHIVVDQSYGGVISEAFKKSKHHSNVIVMSGTRSNEYAFNNEYTNHWLSYNSSQVATKCSQNIHEESVGSVRNSTPDIQEGHEGVVKATIFGAPCDVRPPFTRRELRQEYLGCQNLPTAVWLMKVFRTRQSDSDRSGLWS